MLSLDSYKTHYHFSTNFWSVFLLITFIPDLLGIAPSLVVYSFWLLKASLSLWLILKYRKKIYHLNKEEKLFVAVAFIYFINMFIDVFLQKSSVGFGSPIDFISFCLTLLIAFSFRYDPEFCSKKSYTFFMCTLSIGLIIAFFLAKQSPPPLIGRMDANSTVNTINYGQMGCALSLTSIYGFMNIKLKYGKIIFIFLFILGVASILKAGSRSPIVVLVLVSSFYFLAKSGFWKGLIIISTVLTVFYFSIGFIIELSESLGSGLPARIISAVESGETSGRDKIYLNTLNIIKDSPLFGDYYLITSGVGRKGYPHNFFLEAILTTGLLGGIPFFLMYLIAIFKSFVLLKNNHVSSWVVLLFLQLSIYGMFSSSLYSSQDFWALCLLVLSIVPLRKIIYSSEDGLIISSKLV